MYSEQFRKRAIKLAETSGLSKKEIAQKLDISTSTLSRWLRLSRDDKTINTVDYEVGSAEDSQSRKYNGAGSSDVAETKPRKQSANLHSANVTYKHSSMKQVISSVTKSTRNTLTSSNLAINKNQTIARKSHSELRWQRLRFAAALFTLFIGLNAFLFWWPSTNSLSLGPQINALAPSEVPTDQDPRSATALMIPKLGEVAKLSPLSPDPYEARLTELGSNLAEPDMATIMALSEAVMVRDKRKIAPRLVRLQNFVESNNWGLAVNELSVIYTLWPDGRERVIESLVALMRQDATANTIIMERLRTKPLWGRRLVSQLPIESLDSAAARAAIAKYPDMYSKYVQQIAEAKGYRSAYLAWLSLLEDTDNRVFSFPIDADFDGSDAPRPFNWSFYRSNVELDGLGGLYVNYDGRRPTRLAWQIILLTAGDYILKTEWDGAYTSRAGDFEWRVSCQDSDTELTTLKLSKGLGAPPNNKANFTVPVGNCSFLTLGLYGIPGEYPDTIRITIDYVHITTEGADRE